jgi:hypothetical protein
MFGVIVLGAVQLDYKSCLSAIKISNIWADDLLPVPLWDLLFQKFIPKYIFLSGPVISEVSSILF